MNKTEAIACLRAFMEAVGLTGEDLLKLEESTAHKEPTLEDLCPRKRWVPKNGGRYHLVSAVGLEIYDTWANTDNDLRCLAIGNVFPTEAAAREHIKNMKAWVELRERSCEDTGDSLHTVSLKGWPLPGVRFASAKSRDRAVEAVGGNARIEKLINWTYNK